MLIFCKNKTNELINMLTFMKCPSRNGQPVFAYVLNKTLSNAGLGIFPYVRKKGMRQLLTDIEDALSLRKAVSLSPHNDNEITIKNIFEMKIKRISNIRKILCGPDLSRFGLSIRAKLITSLFKIIKELDGITYSYAVFIMRQYITQSFFATLSFIQACSKKFNFRITDAGESIPEEEALNFIMEKTKMYTATPSA
jgi:hypothetical protein